MKGRFPEHLCGDGPVNPFPGLKALERRIGHDIPHQLGSNEGLDMPHSVLRAALGEAFVEQIRSYGDAEAYALRQRLSEQLQLPLEALLVDAGADSLIALALRGLVAVGETVVCAAGTYPTFAYFAQGHGCVLEEVPYHQTPEVLAPDLDALAERAIQCQARLVYLANPDNPSGYLHSDAAIAALRDRLPEDCWLLLDEAYHDFRDDETDSAVWPGVLRLRTFSKAHGLAGLRVGYAIGDPDMLAVLLKVRIHYAVSSIAQQAVCLLLDQPDEVTLHIQQVKARRARLRQLLLARGYRVMPSDTNFVAVCLTDAAQAMALQQSLLAAGILVARPAHPALAHLLRITAIEDALTCLADLTPWQEG